MVNKIVYLCLELQENRYILKADKSSLTPVNTVNFFFCGTQMKGNSELPQGAQGIGDVLSHLSEFIISLIVIKENSS